MENSGLPFKVTPQFVFDMVMRRRWIILVPLCLSLIVGIYLVHVLPRVYEAKTLILIESQRVPQDYVKSIVTEDTAQRINTISQQILSTSNLEKIINDFRLFGSSEDTKLFLEDKVANLRKRISVDVMGNRRETEAFTISFKGQDPEKVMKVANGLASSFIDKNLKERESQAEGTSQFLDSELETMRKRLEGVEEAIKNYRERNMGELPEQLDTNLRIVDRLQQNLGNQEQQLREAKTRLADLQNRSTRNGQNTAPVVIIDSTGNPNQVAGANLDDLKAELQRLLSKYTPKHPDVVRLQNRIAEIEADQTDGSKGGGAAIPPGLRSQIKDTVREIQVSETDIESLKKQIAEYQARIEQTPKREQELLGLRRDYQNIQASYDSLLHRKLEADIAVNMERKQKGEQFRVVDPARLPQRPVEPDTRKLFLMVIALGCSLGVGSAFVLEILNASFHSPAEIEEQYEIPVITTIPFLVQQRDIVLRKINDSASIAFTGLVCVLLLVFGLLSYMGPGFLRHIAEKAGII